MKGRETVVAGRVEQLDQFDALLLGDLDVNG